MNEYEEGEADEPVVEEVAAPAWDGAIDTLLTQPWVPEDARPHLEKHLTAHQEATRRRDFLDSVFAAGDATAELTKALETTKGELASLKEAMGKAEKERDEYKGKADTYEEEKTKAENDKRLADWREKYADIFTEQHEYETPETPWHGAWREFYKFIEQGYSEEKAAKMARAFLPDEPAPAATEAKADPPAPAAPKPPAERKVEVPKSVAAAGRSSSSPSVTVNSAEANENLEARILRMEKEERARVGLR